MSCTNRALSTANRPSCLPPSHWLSGGKKLVSQPVWCGRLWDPIAQKWVVQRFSISCRVSPAKFKCKATGVSNISGHSFRNFINEINFWTGLAVSASLDFNWFAWWERATAIVCAYSQLLLFVGLLNWDAPDNQLFSSLPPAFIYLSATAIQKHFQQRTV